jgi:hypothetical protein
MSPTLEAEIAFTCAVALTPLVTPADVRASKLFDTAPQVGLPHDLGAVDHDSVVPWTLTPTNVFEQALLNSLRRDGDEVPEKKLPLDIKYAGDTTGRLSLRLSLLPPSVLIVTVSVRGLSFNGDDFPDRAIAWQIADDPYVARVLARSVGLVKTLNQREIASVPLGRRERAVRIRLQQPADTIHGFVQARRRELVGLVHHEARWSLATDESIERVFFKNEELNYHAHSPYRLVDKQGVVQIEAAQGASPPFERLVRWQALAVAFREFLVAYRSRREQAPRTYDLVLGKVASWIRDPERVIRDSVSGQETWKLVCREMRIDQELDRVLSTADVRERLDRAAAGHDELGSDWWREPDLEGFLSGVGDLNSSFVSDPDLRTFVDQAYRDARRAFDANALLASLLASRCAAEALLRARGVSAHSLRAALAESEELVPATLRTELGEALSGALDEITPPTEDAAKRALKAVAALARQLEQDPPGASSD